MTELEMQIEFDRLVELQSKELGSIEKPDSTTVARFLTNAQLRYLSDTYLQGGSQDIIRNRVNEIPQLVQREIVDTTEDTDGPYGSTNAGNAYYFDTDDLTTYTFMFYIRSDSFVRRTKPSEYAHASTSKWVQNKLISYSEIDKVLTTAYNTPILLEPRVIIEEDDAANNNSSRIIILTDSYTTLNSGTDQTSTLHLTYLKEPADIAINNDSDSHVPESPVHLHQKIVEMAVHNYVYYEYGLQAKLEKPGDNQ